MIQISLQSVSTIVQLKTQLWVFMAPTQHHVMMKENKGRVHLLSLIPDCNFVTLFLEFQKGGLKVKFFFCKNAFFRTHIGVKKQSYNLELMIINEPFPNAITLLVSRHRTFSSTIFVWRNLFIVCCLRGFIHWGLQLLLKITRCKVVMRRRLQRMIESLSIVLLIKVCLEKCFSS